MRRTLLANSSDIADTPSCALLLAGRNKTRIGGQVLLFKLGYS